jgi:thiol-disulfide isomerase/thioredoxin
MNQKIYDPGSKHDIMIGYCTLAGITDSAFNSVYKEEYNVYIPDKEISGQINSLLDGVSVTIVLGTWCGDSREQVPRFMKIIDAAGPAFPDRTVIICVDRDKKAGDVSLDGMDILKVPTFIFYYNGRELGRIIETPNANMEKDLLDILKKQL